MIKCLPIFLYHFKTLRNFNIRCIGFFFGIRHETINSSAYRLAYFEMLRRESNVFFGSNVSYPAVCSKIILSRVGRYA
jgi:hypothetical protein